MEFYYKGKFLFETDSSEHPDLKGGIFRLGDTFFIDDEEYRIIKTETMLDKNKIKYHVEKYIRTN
jgi:hypothetical protein